MPPAKIIDEYVKYAEAIISEEGVHDILKNNHNLDVKEIISPLKDAIVAIDTALTRPDSSLEKEVKYIEAFEFLPLFLRFLPG